MTRKRSSQANNFFVAMIETVRTLVQIMELKLHIIRFIKYF